MSRDVPEISLQDLAPRSTVQALSFPSYHRQLQLNPEKHLQSIELAGSSASNGQARPNRAATPPWQLGEPRVHIRASRPSLVSPFCLFPLALRFGLHSCHRRKWTLLDFLCSGPYVDRIEGATSHTLEYKRAPGISRMRDDVWNYLSEIVSCPTMPACSFAPPLLPLPPSFALQTV